MITNADITLYNAYYDKESGTTKYKRTYIYGVNFQVTKAVKVSDTKGLISADIAKIFIPFTANTEDKRYIKLKEFQRLNESQKDGYFTFSNDDKVVRGIIDFNLTGIKPNNLAYLENMYDDVYNIISVATNDNGSPSMRHWEISGK